MPKRVAEAVRLVGLSTHTLRYYEHEGLVPPARYASTYREHCAFRDRRIKPDQQYRVTRPDPT
ncbi:MerR family transcriptional regulator [Streptomyces lavendulocolor]